MTKIFNNKDLKQIRRQYSIGKYVVDFYCPKIKFAIEVDGLTHQYPDQFEYDKQRQKYIESLGIKVKRYHSDDISKDLDDTVNQIWYMCQQRSEELKNK